MGGSCLKKNPRIYASRTRPHMKAWNEVSPCTAAGQKIHESYMHRSFFRRLVCHHRIHMNAASNTPIIIYYYYSFI